ncbi:MAG: ATP-dependent DNA ligase [Pelagibacterales bacterium]|nr:ATP-dependent DNA ligase [Pelagibacterales bacterium]OUU62872.1 MAG: ATP-dependent DNA ligase [Alphaproteobacteria bacterium TMED62]
MIHLTKLLESLTFTYSTNSKIELLVEYLKKRNIEEKGYTIALLTGNLSFKNIKKSTLLNVLKKELDNYLFEQSYDYVGDLAETVALIWPKKNISKKISLHKIILDLRNSIDVEHTILEYLNNLTSQERWAFIKLILGGLRVGFSSNLVKKSLAIYGNKKINEIENIWNGISPPYQSLFLWLEDKGNYPSIEISKTFSSFMLASSFDTKQIINIKETDEYFFEYKWDGIRVQIVAYEGKTIVYSRSGENITNSFPDIKVNSSKLLVLDGELLVGKNFLPFTFNHLQKRINKKKPSAAQLLALPAFVKVYDILYLNGEDIRNKKLYERRKILENWFSINKNYNLDISKLVKFYSKKKLENLYKKLPFIEGLMIKKKSSQYISGRKKGYWYKWKKDPKYLDAILMYAQRGHGKRSSFYSDYTLGVWSENTVIPIAKAYTGYTDNELNKIDRFIRKNTIAKFGPVREVKKELVVELAFDDAQKSVRHKSGIALRFPRISKIRWDKPASEVMNLEQIKKDLLITLN